MSKVDYRSLLSEAERARIYAYAPYSNKGGGAAILTRDGRIFTGCTVEIANFSSSVCAAKAALIKAITEGARSFAAIALVGADIDTNLFCGDCLQTIAEFDKDTIVISDIFPNKALPLSELLPMMFEWPK